MRLEHNNITVRDIDCSVAFYEQALGLRLRWEGQIEGDHGPLKAVHIGTEDSYLALFQAEKEGEVPRDYRSPGINHLAFVVENLGDYRARLAQLGVRIHLEADYEPGERIYFYDPDGVEIELVSY
jgi:catechol 2,3-dioxygenase-like lactoylglutathione lyase family enzyme